MSPPPGEFDPVKAEMLTTIGELRTTVGDLKVEVKDLGKAVQDLRDVATASKAFASATRLAAGLIIAATSVFGGWYLSQWETWRSGVGVELETLEDRVREVEHSSR